MKASFTGNNLSIQMEFAIRRVTCGSAFISPETILEKYSPISSFAMDSKPRTARIWRSVSPSAPVAAMERAMDALKGERRTEAPFRSFRIWAKRSKAKLFAERVISCSARVRLIDLPRA